MRNMAGEDQAARLEPKFARTSTSVVFSAQIEELELPLLEGWQAVPAMSRLGQVCR